MITEQENRTNTPEKKLAARLRKLADGMTPAVEAKLNPPVGDQRPTPRRMRIADAMRKEGERLRLAQALLYKLASLYEAGEKIPAFLAEIKSKKAAIELLWHSDHRATVEQLTDCGPAEDPKTKQLRELEQSLIGLKIPGFFLTPDPLASRIIELAEIDDNHDVLEPSAGAGNLADKVGLRGSFKCCEINYRLREILALKGYDLVEHDFLSHEGDYDRIVMNPPFEQLADIDHVRHAYSLLRSGGRMVSVMGAGPFFRDDRKAKDFRDWLETVGGESSKVPEGTFLDTITSTGVSTRLVVIERP